MLSRFFSLGLNVIIAVFPFLDNFKNAIYLSLAPIIVEILMCRRSAYEIETDSGTNGDQYAKSFCSKNNN